MTPPLPHRPPDGKPLSEQPEWRRDFPIETAEDEYVSRRDFAKFLVLTSGAMATGQVVLVAKSKWKQSSAPPEPLAITRDDELKIHDVVAFHFPTHADPCLLTRYEDGRLLAYGQLCPHLLCPVIPEVEKGLFTCPCHKGSFDVETGRPISGPPRRPLPTITLEVRDDGMIYAIGVELVS
jgi:Rieske Fe-S protein